MSSLLNYGDSSHVPPQVLVSNCYYVQFCLSFFCCSLLLLLAPLLVVAATMANEFIDDFRRKIIASASKPVNKYGVLFSLMQMQID